MSPMIALTCCWRQFPGCSMGGRTKTKASSLTELRGRTVEFAEAKAAINLQDRAQERGIATENEPQRFVGGLCELFAEY